VSIDWEQRFETVARRKTEEAAAARLEPYRTVSVGATGGLRPIGNGWTRRLFDGDFLVTPEDRDLPATSLVFVQSKDGNTGTRNPSALGGGETDKHLVYEGLSRVAADGVLAGAETIRGTNLVLSVWRPELVELREALRLPRHPVQIVATLGGLRFDDTLIMNVPALRVVIVTTREWDEAMREELARRRWITTVTMAGRDDLPSAFRTLRSMGLSRISAIGGRTIARAMIDAGLVSDLYLTTSPTPGGEPHTPIYPTTLDGRLAVRKAGTGIETGVRFEHMRLSRRDSADTR
jgi:riboflavin biosynthesis pyrimidine reductase